MIDDEARKLIYDKVPSSVLRARAREMGMRTLREDGVRKVLAGHDDAGRSHPRDGGRRNVKKNFQNVKNLKFNCPGRRKFRFIPDFNF